MIACVLRHALSMPTDLLKNGIQGMLSVKELPYIHAGGVETKTSEAKTGIGVEEHSPVVKLLPEHDTRVHYRFFVVFHRSISHHSLTVIVPKRHYQPHRSQRNAASYIPRRLLRRTEGISCKRIAGDLV
jgi:hypothetical protein